MSEHEELFARLHKLEDENRRLSARLDELARPVSRRAMFKRAGQVALGAAALSVGAEVAAAPTAAADDKNPVLQGVTNFATNGTALYADHAGNAAALTVSNDTLVAHQGYASGLDAFGDYGVFGTGDYGGVIGQAPGLGRPVSVPVPAGVVGIGVEGVAGVFATSQNGEAIAAQTTSGLAAVHGNCQNDNGIGVFGDGSYAATGVYGHSGSGDGVRGIANEGHGVFGLAVQPNGVGVLGVSVERSGVTAPAAAVTGDSKDQNGVQGLSKTARGGVFAGGQAAIRLLPGSLTNTAPANGQNGDFYVDSTGGLWYYRGSWHQLA
ncbi:hypothetical protein [Kutzneria buriramensis]|uniref:Uncharacterized protein n=1 Tax=Kutzneria buriramensis TaxID=1045776 RepID=A0A3E0HQ65_9PSEU|nr:hypothetical protein [Kutzneria buriramensis]REH48531.1 hypothetical protein BCF44_105390 [Kutzneria buriramensis]